ncbi:MAG: 50S ribosomal protein L17 [Candidatus Harrisonbacteria bacterium CG10_big_fil_rev_8_21_14_0_10_40_38]|uniref:50S ribosomal protein L17 n=1 Tax=Candidatus Harrisonbacteria bacterium CG10_big_fil_rev_8_21_14_0_10_40_38 TaxID=1974583 RepID=A0A2H0UTW9_9BACT|nr:MAG: 50S ribosomal protein L17 [Candidatus Harrisonbacteria bacterium CG10_big_fil_rev_8_21_14_0_10_40_38]
MRKFNLKRGPRKLFIQKLANNLIVSERIMTTQARAKEIRPVVERFVTIAKKQSLASHRQLLSSLPEKSAHKLFYDIALRYKGRAGGYLRIIKQASVRKRDGAPKAVIEFVK